MGNCMLDIPYPPVRTMGKNLANAALLSNDLAGVVSEMSAVSKYVFQHIICQNKEISETVMCIAIVEMHHLEIIGELITAFGGTPKYAITAGCAQKYWSGNYLCYETNPTRFLKDNISNEYAAIANYRIRIGQIRDPMVQKVLERIILDEEYHIKLFNGLLEKYGK